MSRTYYDHTGDTLRRVVAASIDVDLLQRRDRHSQRLLVEHVRMNRERRAKADAVIVAAREARIASEKAHERVRTLVQA